MLEPEAGPCDAIFPSYFFNSTSGYCEQFFYGGCGGNDNRFSLLEDCQESCGRESFLKDCAPGTTCHVDKETGRGECIGDPCAVIRCGFNTVCQVNQETGQGECVPRDEEPTTNSCSYVLCQPGFECQINEEMGAGECVSPGLPTSCSALSCIEGTACVVDVNTGIAECVPSI